MFFYGTLTKNLTSGTKPGDPDAKPSRLYKICQKFDGPESNVLEYISTSDGDDAGGDGDSDAVWDTDPFQKKCKTMDNKIDAQLTWRPVLSHTEKHLLFLARALIANPELL